MSTPTIRSIQEVVARHFGLAMIDLLSDRVDAGAVRGRHVAMYIARRLTSKSLPQIGISFNRDHTSVIHAVKRIKAARLKEKDLDLAIESLSSRIMAQHRDELNNALVGWVA